MAIRIPILTSFDPKGLKQANAQFAKLQSSVGSLGRNFAVAGAAIGAAGAIIAKNAQALARIEAINAQTAQTIKSMGNASQISATQVETLAGSLEALTATEAETIQEGANLLLTFKNISNQAGAGNDIFNQTTAVMVDLARAMGTSASGEAIRLGKALNDPIRGIASLTRVGVSFTNDQREQIKALQESGDLMGAQKIILAELQAQFGGSGAAFAQTFSGQLELMGHELGTIGEEATMSVMPALQGMIEQLRELIPVLGPQLKAAIESIDFKALGEAVVGFTTFLVQNGEAIAKAIIALFLLSTAYKTLAVATGIAKTAIALNTYFVAQAATGITLATVATKLFSAALRLIPFVAIATGLALIVTKVIEAKGSMKQAAPVVTSFGTEILKTGHDAQWAAGRYGVLTNAINKIPKNVKLNLQVETNSRNTALNNYLGFLGGRAGEGGGVVTPTVTTPTPTTGGGSAEVADTGLSAWTANAKKEARIAAKEAELIGKGLSASVAASLVGTNTPIKTANEALARIARNGQQAVDNLTRRYNQSAAGQQAAADAAAAAAQATADAAAAAASEQADAVAAASQAAAAAAQAYAAEMAAAHEASVRAAEAAARAEAEALAERQRVFNSFADAVKSTFSGIRNSILGAFDLRQLGGSTNAITRNMEKLLNRLRSFTLNVRNLAGMGLDPALLQQVISAGPMAGARLAAGLVAGGASGLSAINAGFSEFGSLSSQIAATGTGSMFGQSSQQNIYNIEVGGGVGSGATIGKAIVDAIKSYERTSGAVWQGA